jgi:hypothetical protein
VNRLHQVRCIVSKDRPRSIRQQRGDGGSRHHLV